MWKLGNLTEIFIEDVNKEDSKILEVFGRTVDFLFLIIVIAGVPFFIYVLSQFGSLG